MKLFKRVSKNDKQKPLTLDEVFTAIKIWGNEGFETELEKIRDLFLGAGISEKSSIDLVIFLPTAFVMNLLSDVDYPDYYIEINQSGKSTEKRFDLNESFMTIWKATQQYFASEPDRDTILKISIKSSEFHAINKALEDGAELEDLQLSPPVINFRA